MDKNHWFEYLIGACMALLGGYVTLLAWIGKRATARMDGHETRLRELESTRVTQDDIDELRRSLTASIVNVGQRAETYMRDLREDQASMHKENQAFLMRFEEKIDANEQRAANTRHKTYNDIHKLAMDFAVEFRKKNRDREE